MSFRLVYLPKPIMLVIRNGAAQIALHLAPPFGACAYRSFFATPAQYPFSPLAAPPTIVCDVILLLCTYRLLSPLTISRCQSSVVVAVVVVVVVSVVVVVMVTKRVLYTRATPFFLSPFYASCACI